MRLQGLVHFYRLRLRIHGLQELLAGVGVAIPVALVFAVTVANGSIEGSASAIVRGLVGPAQLQLYTRGPAGFSEQVLSHVERLPGVSHAAPVLEEPATIQAPDGRRAEVTVAGMGLDLASLDGLAHTLPPAMLSRDGIGLSRATAGTLGLSGARPRGQVRIMLDGMTSSLDVSAVLGREAAGALSQAQVAIMPLPRLQRLTGSPGRISRILVRAQPAHVHAVAGELARLAAGRLSVAPADQDVSLLRQALGPSSQASDLFAGLAGLLGFLFAFNAILLTAPERREAIVGLRIDGTSRGAIVQMTIFQALCLGIAASLVGLLAGYALAGGFFHQSPGYLTKAFMLGTNTVVGALPVAVSLGGGILASCLASLVPLRDLRKGRPVNARSSRSQGGSIRADRRLIAIAAALALAAAGLFVFVPSAAIFACVLLALTTVIAVPLILAATLWATEAIALRNPKLTALPLAANSLKGTTLRSVALTGTGAVALFGCVALSASKDDLLRGIYGYTQHYAGSADIWLVNPADNQATSDFRANDLQSRVARIPGVASAHTFQGSYLDYAGRRVWVIAWPPASRFGLLNNQIVNGSQRAATRHLGQEDAITISAEIAAEHHVGVGGRLALPTPTGSKTFDIAATTTNFGWSPGAILMSTSDYRRAWESPHPSAIGVTLASGADAAAVSDAIRHMLGANSGLEVLTARARANAIDRSASEGLSQLGEISTLLVVAAILAMLAALGSSIWQQRIILEAELCLEGAHPGQKRRVLLLLLESAIMLAAGCVTGTVAGICGQFVIDGYLRHVTGFPVAQAATGAGPLEIFSAVMLTVLLFATIPGWLACRAPARLTLDNSTW